MKSTQLNRLMNFISRTNDKAIILDQETDQMVVVMPFDNYEQLVEESRPFMPDMPFSSPNRGHEDAYRGWDDDKDNEIESLADELQPEFIQETADEAEKFEPTFFAPEKPLLKTSLNFSEDWASEQPFNPRGMVEESLESIADEEEEEKFYLEPIE